MSIPVWVEQTDGKFTASVLGSSQIRATGETKARAVATLVSDLKTDTTGELMMIEWPVSRESASYTDDEIEFLRELTAEAYRQRDEEKTLEFPG